MKQSGIIAILSCMFLGIASCNDASALDCTKTLKIAVLDTGLDLKDPRFAGHICRTGHHNFVRGETLTDVEGHGTSVAGLIMQYAGNTNYCFLIYKYYSTRLSGEELMNTEVLALKEAVRNGADIVNLSGGGPSFNEEEYGVIYNNPTTIFIVAAGNDNKNLDSIYGFYPASYFLKNEVAVGNINPDGTRARTSNWGKKVKAKEIGVDVISMVPCFEQNGNVYCNKYLSGTSMSAAIHTGKLANKISKYCESRK